ncbi:hypothetical protein GALMADRAFT_765892 [Galerina marginata CBS 339.88]|uniref:Uncharacterized protein n=1 Tax=Galerina marginata (strain CBS 339.88) TaxID=685588 RepID=A0A067SQ63_GALM3|nr:hypothetical protein GALMADRAFT_765892 [Galerina marginata CBS 339.88]
MGDSKSGSSSTHHACSRLFGEAKRGLWARRSIALTHSLWYLPLPPSSIAWTPPLAILFTIVEPFVMSRQRRQRVCAVPSTQQTAAGARSTRTRTSMSNPSTVNEDSPMDYLLLECRCRCLLTTERTRRPRLRMRVGGMRMEEEEERGNLSSEYEHNEPSVLALRLLVVVPLPYPAPSPL